MGTIAEKGAYLNTTKSLLKDKINALGGSIDDETTFREYANQLDGIYETLPKTSFEEGESITLENTLKGKLNFQDGKVGFGQSKQTTTTGIQLINIPDIAETSRNGITYSCKDGILKLNGTATGGFEIWLSGTSTSGSLSVESGSYTFAGQVISGSRTSGVCGKYVRNTAGSNNIIDGNQIETYIQKNLADSYSNCSVYLYISSGTVLDNLVVGISLVKGLYTQSTMPPFEQYSGGYASPNPNWEQEIKYVRGRNRLNIDVTNDSTSIGNLTYSHTSSEFTLKGTASSTYVIFLLKKVPNISPKGSITMSAIIDGTCPKLMISVYLRDSNNQTLAILRSKSGYITESGTYSLTTDLNISQPIASATFVIEGLQANSNYDMSAKVQLEESSQASPYLPYNTIEEVVSGKNLYKMSNGTMSGSGVTAIRNNGLLSYSATQTTGTYLNASLVEPYKITPGTYTLSIDNALDVAFQIRFQYTPSYNDGGTNVTISQGTTSKTFTLTDTYNYAYLILVFSNGVAISGSTHIQIEKGSTATSWEAYTAKKYQFSLGDHKFYGIGTYRDYILRTTGKNLLNIANFEEGYSIGFDGLPGTYTTTARITNTTPIDVEGLDKVTLSFTAWTGGDKFIYSLLKSDNTLVARETAKTSGTTITIGEAKYLYICFYDGATLSNVKDAMLVKGSTVMDFQPYGSGNWYKIANIGNVVLDGVNNLFINRFATDVSTKYRFVWTDTINGIKNLGNTTKTVLCDKLKQTTAADNYAKIEGIAANSNVLVYVEEISEYSVEDANQWLQNNVLTAYYIFNTPILIPITGVLEEQLEAFWNGQSLDNTTIVLGDGDLPMLINVRALKGA